MMMSFGSYEEDIEAELQYRENIPGFYEDSLDFVKDMPEQAQADIQKYKEQFDLFAYFKFEDSRVRYIYNPARFCSQFNMFVEQGEDLWIGFYKNKKDEWRIIYDYMFGGEK